MKPLQRGGAPGLTLMADGDDQGSATVALSDGYARGWLGGSRRGAESVRPCVSATVPIPCVGCAMCPLLSINLCSICIVNCVRIFT
jgi:hypothetical protein